MTDDLVKRLRSGDCLENQIEAYDLTTEAANRIEELEGAIRQIVFDAIQLARAALKGEQMNERNAEIIEMWNLNFTAQAIGEKLGITRNTIIGVVTRARALGYITRPMVMSASEKGRMGNLVKYGYRRKKR